MEKLSHTTESILDENVEKLAELFPEVVTEVRELDGSLRHTIDVDALKERVGDVAEGQRERYQFTWPGKREAKREAYRQIDKCLRPCPEESVDWDTTGNLYIEGDNLDALKLLRNTYAGKVKMIYIDPPYNTGDDYIYLDDYAISNGEYKSSSGDYSLDGGRLVQNLDSNGRFHSMWCSTLYSRLLLAKDMLSNAGVIFISIDNREIANAKQIADEIFSARCCLGIIIWESKTKCQNTETAREQLQPKQEYILVYSRYPGRFSFLREIVAQREYPLTDEYGIPYREKKIEVMASGGIRGRASMVFPILGIMPPEGKQWKYGSETVADWMERGDVFLKDSAPYLRCRPEDEEAQYDPFWSMIQTKEVGTAESAKKELMTLVGSVGFETVKPVCLLKKLVFHLSKEGKDFTVLDFFSGSATTAHAVMQLNAEDGGNRKFIMVQLPEACDERSEAAKAGYENICEIGKERIRRAGRKIAAEVEEQNRQPKLGEEPKKVPDIGFRVLKIDSSNFEDVSAEPAEYTQQTLAGLADNLKPGRTAEDLLFQVMPQFQIPLSAKIEKRNVNGSTVFSVDDGRLVACFDRNVATETIVAMAKSQPDYAVMRDASFTGDDAVSNFGELFKTYSSATITRVV